MAVTMDPGISYIVTEDFRELNEAVISCDVQSVILLGSKGCGKTIATIALLLNILKGGRTALYITPVILQNLGLESMMPYVKELVEQYQKVCSR